MELDVKGNLAKLKTLNVDHCQVSGYNPEELSGTSDASLNTRARMTVIYRKFF